MLQSTKRAGDKSFEVTEDFSEAEIWFDLVERKRNFMHSSLATKGNNCGRAISVVVVQGERRSVIGPELSLNKGWGDIVAKRMGRYSSKTTQSKWQAKKGNLIFEYQSERICGTSVIMENDLLSRCLFLFEFPNGKMAEQVMLGVTRDGNKNPFS
ncbi:hypothetical protein H5410_013140 [Solanum commersonii]|uniref:Uncharacterized protein n=1 Tax=Solanum commersonii TaxID=4109 RepID=A0A9J6AUL1_SOLCO|nr:hypothetical protein H5410_013140 [Solanum commersonii]